MPTEFDGPASQAQEASAALRAPRRRGWPPANASRPVLLGFIGFLFLTGAASLWGHRGIRAASERQPVAFNHKKHVKDLELACSSCHQFYEKETFSGLPDAEVCATCHSEQQGKSKEEEKLVQRLKAGATLSWVSLFRQPAHVFYSHRRHVVTAKIECAVCHGSIAETSAPPTRVRRLQMQDCLDCHRRSGAPTDCTGCHR